MNMAGRTARLKLELFVKKRVGFQFSQLKEVVNLFLFSYKSKISVRLFNQNKCFGKLKFITNYIFTGITGDNIHGSLQK